VLERLRGGCFGRRWLFEGDGAQCLFRCILCCHCFHIAAGSEINCAAREILRLPPLPAKAVAPVCQSERRILIRFPARPIKLPLHCGCVAIDEGDLIEAGVDVQRIEVVVAAHARLSLWLLQIH
jgi:hypothetical protein